MAEIPALPNAPMRRTIRALLVALLCASPPMFAAEPTGADATATPAVNPPNGAADRAASKAAADKFDASLPPLVEDCGDLKNYVGPFDYRIGVAELRAGHRQTSREADYLVNVEGHHINEDVLTLRRGISSTAIQDLHYTLRAFPNHHPALWAVMRFEQLHGPPPINRQEGQRYSVHCYIDRALRLAPDDGLVWMLWGVHLHKKGDIAAAVEKYRKALAVGVDSAELHYNLGLALLKLGDRQGALAQGKEAYAKGYPLDGLKRKLQKLGLWTD